MYQGMFADLTKSDLKCDNTSDEKLVKGRAYSLESQNSKGENGTNKKDFAHFMKDMRVPSPVQKLDFAATSADNSGYQNSVTNHSGFHQSRDNSDSVFKEPVG